MKIKAFITHKLKETYVDCQDRFEVNADRKSIALSDGMGSTWQQKIWAQLLVDEFTQSSDWIPDKDSIKPLCSDWRKKVVDFIEHLKETEAPKNMIYRNERNLAEGRSAGATFVGIRFDAEKWKGTVLGDSCLIEWSKDDVVFHSSQEVESFDSFPDYFDSDASKEGKGTPKEINGVLNSGGCLFLVSDPFSDFLLEHKKKGEITQYLKLLQGISSHEDFEALVEDWRKAGMHNDDTTLVMIEHDGSEDFSMQEIDNITNLIGKDKEEEDRKEKIIAQVTPEARQNIEEKEEILSSTLQSSYDFVDTNTFIVEFLTEYKSVLQSKCKSLRNLKFKVTNNAAKEALCKMFERYSIIRK